MIYQGIPKCNNEGSTGVTNQEFNNSAFASNSKLSKTLQQAALEVLSPELAQKTLDLAAGQESTTLKKGSTLAKAREEVHVYGTSHIKVRACKRNGYTKQVVNKKKDLDHKRRMLERRAERVGEGVDHEGFLDTTIKHVFSLDKDVFQKVVGEIMDTIRAKINTQKALLEIVLGVDAHTLLRYILTVVCSIATAFFAHQAASRGAWLPIVLAGLSAVSAAYFMKEEIFSYALSTLGEYVYKHFGPKHPIVGATSDEEFYAAVDDFLKGGDDDDVKPEGGEWLFRTGSAMLGEVLQGILVGGIGFAIFNKKGKMVESLAKIPNIAKGITALLELVLKWIASVIDELFGTTTSAYFSQNKELDAWAKEVMHTADAHDAGTLEVNTTSAAHVLRLTQKGRDLAASSLITTNLGHQVHRAAMRELEKLQLHYNRVGLGTESRPEPLGFLLMGESGCGKSTCTQRLTTYTGIRCMKGEQRDAFIKDKQAEIYTNLIEEEHANGYRGQFFAILDDFGQQKAAPGAKTEAMVIIRWINANAPRLNMAALHEKGNVSFTSEMIFASTNRYTFWDMNIVQPEALLRRWKRIVIVTIKKEYCTPETRDGDIKQRRLDRELVKDGFNEDVNEFHLQRIVDPKQQTFATERVMSFKEFEDMIVEDYKTNQEQHKRTMSSIQAGADIRLAQVLAEERGEVKFECGFETEEQIQQRAKVRALEERLRRLNATRHMTWSEWTLHTSFQDKVMSVKDYFGCVAKKAKTAYVVKRARQLTGDLLDEFHFQVVDKYNRFRRMSMSEKMEIIAMINMLIVMTQTYIFPIISKLCGVISNWFGGALKGFLPRDNRITFERMREFAEFIMKDQRHFLETRGYAVVETASEASFEPLYKQIVKECNISKDRTMEYKRAHIDNKVGCYKLEPIYQTGFFATPSCDSVFAERYVTGVFQHNVYHMYNDTLDPQKHNSGGKAIVVKDKLLLINKHFITQMMCAVKNADKELFIQFVPHGRPEKIIRVPLRYMADPINHSGGNDSEDAILINMGPYFSAHKDIIDKFVSDEVVPRLRDHAFSVYVPESPYHMKQHDVRGTFADVVSVGTNQHKGMFWYIAPTKDGDCGGPLIEKDDKDSKSRIVGIHAAGETREGMKVAFAQRISSNMLKRWASKWDDILTARPSELLDHESANFLGLKVVRKDTHNNVVMTQNSLVPSYMHGWAGPPTRVPAILHPFTNSKGEMKYPLLNALSNENANNVPLDTDLVDTTVYMLVKKLLPHIMNRNKVLTTEEAIVGVPGTALKAIARNTSAGYYGYANPGVKPGKKGALGTDGEYTLGSKECQKLIAHVAEIFERMKRGEVIDIPYVIFLKVEKRSLKKVEDGNARIVKAASVDDVIVIRKVYGHVVSSVMTNHTICGIAVGINALGGDWDFLARMLQKRGKKIIAGDFAKFDQSQSGQLLRATLSVISQLAGHSSPEIKMVEKCIAETLAAPRCLIGNLVYENDHGLPSGNPLTSIMNSIFVQLAFRLVWVLLMQNPDETKTACLKRFDEHVTLVSYGDDHLANISDECSERFNQNTLIAAFPKLGLHYTSDDKEDLNPPDYRNIEEVTFLKRSFRWDDRYGKYMGPLDLQTLKEVCYYTNAKGAPEEITRDNVERTFRELALHGRATYEFVGSELELYHNSRSERPVTKPPYETALEEVMGQAPGLGLAAVG